MSVFVVNILVFILILLIIGFNVMQYFHVWRYIEKLPGPKPMPIFGNILQVGFTLEENFNTVMKWWYEYGCDKYRGWCLNKPFVIISNPKDIEEVLCNNELLDKSFVYDVGKSIFGEGLVTAKASKWSKFRKIINPSFHHKMLVDYLEIMNRCSNNFIEKLSKYADSGEIFDIHKLASFYAIEVICESIFDIPFSSSTAKSFEIISAVIDLSEIGFKRIFSIIKPNNFLFKFTSDYPKFEKATQILKDFISEIIIKRRKQLQCQQDNNSNKEKESDSEFNGKMKKDLIDNLLTAQVDNRPLNFQEISDEIMTFLFAGHDTIVSAIMFEMYILSRFPHIQEEVLKEQVQIFHDNKERNITYEDIQKMQYFDLFIKETLRVFPSVPVIARQVNKNFHLGKYEIPAGTTIVPFIFGMGRNEKYFKDPLKFDPTRFSPENRVNSSPYDTIPFSAGPRHCIGQKFSIFEMKAALSKIIRKYEILPPYDKCCDKTSEHTHNVFDEELRPPILQVAISLVPKDFIQLRLQRRRKISKTEKI